MKKPGIFITFEGTDGVGKSTHARLVKEWLGKQGKNVVMTREPGGGPLAEKIRKILLDPKSKMAHLAELFLYEAARADHVERTIEPALREGKWVICDRFTDATLAYQGTARGLSEKKIHLLNAIATNGRSPDLTLWLDLSPQDGLQKAIAKKGKGDRLENEGIPFQEQVRKGYAQIARREPRRVKRITVDSTVEKTQAKIRSAIAMKFLA